MAFAHLSRYDLIGFTSSISIGVVMWIKPEYEIVDMSMEVTQYVFQR